MEKYIGNSIKIDLYKNRLFTIMRFHLDSFLFRLLIRYAEKYYGDSLKDVILTDKSIMQWIISVSDNIMI